MTAPPENPKIYHITHVDNLPSILAEGGIESDGRRLRKGGGQTAIGMTEIKRRRLFEIEVACHRGTKVGDYVPFYFCPRSIMLYIIYRDNHPDMTYHGGQGPILHLRIDLGAAMAWADRHQVRWAFSDRNAGSYYTDFYSRRDLLDAIDWRAVTSTDFRDPVVKEGKQAEFLIHDVCPWPLVERVGVHNEAIRCQVETLLQREWHKPVVAIERSWYY